MPNLCGINQKLLAEKLNEVRKMPSQKKGKTGMSGNTSTTSVSLLWNFIVSCSKFSHSMQYIES